MSLRTTFGGHSLARKSRAERRSISCSSENAKSIADEIVRPAVRRAGAAPWAPLAPGAPWALQRPPARAEWKLFSPRLVGLVLEPAGDQASARALQSPRERGPRVEVRLAEQARQPTRSTGPEAGPAKGLAAVAPRSP